MSKGPYLHSNYSTFYRFENYQKSVKKAVKSFEEVLSITTHDQQTKLRLFWSKNAFSQSAIFQAVNTPDFRSAHI